MDSKLCKEACNLSLNKVLSRITPLVNRIEIINNGVLVIGRNSTLTIEECEKFNLEVAQVLQQ